jgi:hypothetical protein
MVFNDTTNKLGLIQECEFNCDLGYGGISGNSDRLAEFTRLINKWNNIIEIMIIQSNDEWDFDDSNQTDFPIGTSNLVASQQQYQLPTNLKIKRVEISYDGTNWYKAEPFDLSEMSDAATTTNISSNFNTQEPFYDTIGDSIFLYPIPAANVTGGLKVWYTRSMHDFTSSDTTAVPGFDANFHYLLAVGVSYDWCAKKKLTQTAKLKSDLQTGLSLLKVHYGKKVEDRQNFMNTPYSFEDGK